MDAFALGARLACPAAETLLPAMEGTLPEPLRGKVLSHLEHCTVCRMLADAQASPECSQPTVDESNRIQARVRRTRRSTSAWWRAAAAAAVITIAAGAGWLAQFDQRGALMPVAPAAPAAKSTRNVPTFVLDLEKPSIELPPGALVLRSRGADPEVTGLIDALEPFRNGDYSQAIQRLTALHANHPDDQFVNYYLGVSYLLAGRAADAVNPLQRARFDGTGNTWLRLDASWYLAVALERSGQRDAAVGVLTELCGNDGLRRQQACGALGNLLAPRIGERRTGEKIPAPLLAGADPSDRRAGSGTGRPVS